MKKCILLFWIFFSATLLRAEDALQVVPFEAQPRATTVDGYSFSIEMNNTTADVWAFQFDILLPAGMTLDNTDGLNPFELGDRCPYTIGRGGVKNFKHIVNYKLQEDGWWRVVVITTEADRINGSSGEVLRAYYLADGTMEEGLHPILIRDAILTINGNSDIKLAPSSSYCYVGDSPLTTDALPDLSSLTGYIPSWVITSINEDISTNENFVGLDISGADNVGASVIIPNKNALCYVKENAEFDYMPAGNIVECSQDGYTCKHLTLHDGEYSLFVPQGISCTSASFERTFKAGYWSTVCLPFALSAEVVQQIKEQGVEIECLSSFDATKGTLFFAGVDEMLANTPYIIKCSKDMTPFTNIVIDAVEPTLQTPVVDCGDAAMSGNYITAILNSDAVLRYYVFDASNGSFVLVGANAKVLPFRAYLTVPSSVQLAKSLSITHSDGSLTTITDIMHGSEKTENVYSLEGAVVRTNINSDFSLEKLPEGVYIIGKKKIFISK